MSVAATDRRTTAGASLDETAGHLFGHCLSAFQAFHTLPELAEDMRILSLNAELAAGRAGTAGVAVRALTQYTRQLVTQLARLQDEMGTLESRTHGLSARTMRDLQQLRLMRAARRACETAWVRNAGQLPAEAIAATREALVTAEAKMAGTTGHSMTQMMANAQVLASQAARVRQVTQQSNGIATNIAIEAAAAGPHEPEFRTVAYTMKRYIGSLTAMTERADHAVSRAVEVGAALSRGLGDGATP